MDKYGFVVTTWGYGAFYAETMAHLPPGPHLVIDCKAEGWPLSKAWNVGIREMLNFCEVVVVCNDDVILRPDTGDLLHWGLTEGQFTDKELHSTWGDRPELLLLSCRHASPSDARTDNVDWQLLDNAKPEWQPGPDFSCFAVTSKLFEKVGEFNEELLVWFGDNDMHRRLHLAGYDGGALAPYWHFLNGTTRRDPERQAVMHDIFERDRNRYILTWGGVPGQETYDVPYGRVRV